MICCAVSIIVGFDIQQNQWVDESHCPVTKETPFVTHSPVIGAWRSTRSDGDSGAFGTCMRRSTRKMPVEPRTEARGIRHVASYRLSRGTSLPKQYGRDHDRSFFCVGTGVPGIFTVTAPRWVRLVKDRGCPFTGCKMFTWSEPRAG